MVRVAGASYPLVSSDMGQFRNTTENGHYQPEMVKVLQDNGCEFSPKCTKCPLPKCRYEYKSIRALRNEVFRDPQILALRREGFWCKEIAAKLSISLRTVFRILEVNNGRAAY